MKERRRERREEKSEGGKKEDIRNVEGVFMSGRKELKCGQDQAHPTRSPENVRIIGVVVTLTGHLNVPKPIG